MARHRVPSVGSSLRRFDDPATSSDPQIRELVTALSTLEFAPPPRAHFRAELRAQLVAVTPRLVTEGPLETVAVRSSTAQAESQRSAVAAKLQQTASRLRSLHLGRPLGVAVAAFTIFAALIGGAVFISKQALPGDSLYGVKRASENARLSLTQGVDRGKTYLSFATTRVNEVQALLGSSSATAAGSGVTAASGIDPHTAALITTTLGSANQDTTNASQIFGNSAVASGKPGALANMTTWAPGQISLLDQVLARVPSGPLHIRVLDSLRLVEAADARAEALRPVVGCSCMSHAKSDALGPIPCTQCAAPGPNVTPGQPGPATPDSKPTTGTTPTHAATGRPAAGTSGVPGSGAPLPTVPTTGTPSFPGLPTPTGLPGLPTPTGLPGLPIIPTAPPTGTCSSGLLGALGGLLKTCTSP